VLFNISHLTKSTKTKNDTNIIFSPGSSRSSTSQKSSRPLIERTYPYDAEKRALPDKTCLVRNPNTNCYFFDLGRLQCLQFSHESNVDKGT